mgnify:CR=1 FL=1
MFDFDLDLDELDEDKKQEIGEQEIKELCKEFKRKEIC